jgi:hypothetical protein
MLLTFSLLALQPCVGLGLLHGFATVSFSGVELLAPRPTSNMLTTDYTSLRHVWLYQELTLPPENLSSIRRQLSKRTLYQ